jgi:hypothetical protein
LQCVSTVIKIILAEPSCLYNWVKVIYYRPPPVFRLPLPFLTVLSFAFPDLDEELFPEFADSTLFPFELFEEPDALVFVGSILVREGVVRPFLGSLPRPPLSFLSVVSDRLVSPLSTGLLGGVLGE